MTERTMRARADRRPPKVAIIGAGMVGSSLAYSLIIERLAAEVVLVDVNSDRARGEAMDINHAVPFSGPTTVRAGDYSDCAGADVAVITAGSAQRQGETRLDLIRRNVAVYRDIVPKLVKAAPEAILLVVSNPVDALTYVTNQVSGLPWERVIGSGTILDTARLRYELGALCGVDARSIHAYVIGEHGDSEVPVWSLANIAGVRFPAFCAMCSRRCARRGDFKAIFERVRNAAYEIIRLKGATYFAIALGATRIIEAILRDQNTVMTASILLHGEYGIKDVCLSLPVIVGRQGARHVIEMPVSKSERTALRKSATVLRKALDEVGY